MTDPIIAKAIEQVEAARASGQVPMVKTFFDGPTFTGPTQQLFRSRSTINSARFTTWRRGRR